MDQSVISLMRVFVVVSSLAVGSIIQGCSKAEDRQSQLQNGQSPAESPSSMPEEKATERKTQAALKGSKSECEIAKRAYTAAFDRFASCKTDTECISVAAVLEDSDGSYYKGSEGRVGCAASVNRLVSGQIEAAYRMMLEKCDPFPFLVADCVEYWKPTCRRGKCVSVFTVPERDKRKMDEACGKPRVWEKSGHIYRVCLVRAAWEVSFDFCRRLGGRLLKLESGEENDFAKQLVSDSAWIGARNDFYSEDWMWFDRSFCTHTNWATDNPDNAGPDPEHCAAISADGTWSDANCSKELPFVCEMEKEPS